jgi:hypothetical protein
MGGELSVVAGWARPAPAISPLASDGSLWRARRTTVSIEREQFALTAKAGAVFR